jgi:glycerol-1-phosphate dehydrogenase [NAD(P)+]
VDGIPHDYHGRQVGLGTILACGLYERLLPMDTPDFQVRTEPTDAAYWRTLTEVVEEEHALKRIRAERAVAMLRTAGRWDRVRALIRDSAVPAARVKNCLRRANAAHTIVHIGCSRERFKAAVFHCHQIRERYTVIDLARATHILPAAVDEIIDEYLI